MRPHHLCFLALLAALAGCMSTPSTGGSPSDELSLAQGTALSPWIVLDLTTGSYSPQVDPGDTAAASYRDQHMLFRRVETASGPAYLAVFECTQAQWQRLGGATPWTGIDAAVVAEAGQAGDRPAYGLAWSAVDAVLESWNSGRDFSLAVPSAGEWAAAAAAGLGGPYTWGAAEDRSTVAAHAFLHETFDPAQHDPAPQPVGSRAANAAGFHDLAGNVWEWVSPGVELCGGSWRDRLRAARNDNRLGADDTGIDPDTDHALFGVRLAIRP